MRGEDWPKDRFAEMSTPVRACSLVFFSISLAVGAALVLDRYIAHDLEVPPFLFAVAVSAWYGRAGGAILALVLSCISFDYFFVQPLHTLSVSASDLPFFAIFAGFASLVTWFSAIRRKVEEELRRARDRLEVVVAERTQQASLLNLTHDTIFVRDMNFVIAYWNRGAEDLYGWSAEEAVGKHSTSLLHTVFPAPLEEILAELMRTGRWDGELQRSKRDGSHVIVSSRWSLQRNDGDRATAILETNNDITDRKRREREIEGLNQELTKRSTELEGTNKELEAFAYSVSHDLRAPLRHMAGYSELLQKRAANVLDEKGNHYILMVIESAKRMGSLIDDLLSFSRIGRAETQKTLVNAGQLVKEALSEVRQETEGRDIAWTFGALPDFYGDRSMLRLVLVNLLSNAIKFTRNRPRAEIEVGSAGGQNGEAVVFVRDNGVGFDMQYANKLFGVFQRLHQANEFEGTGIGLATVQRIIHRHGGRVWAEGGVDRGATFYFSAPTQ
jgi:PAS domain S-box-containing protein